MSTNEENQSGVALKRRCCSTTNLISWVNSIETTGYVLCTFKNCKYFAFDVDDMSNHFAFCNSDCAFISHFCEFCDRGSDSADNILRHKIFHHPDKVSYEDMKTYRRRQEDLSPCSGPSKVLKRSWIAILETKNYIKCLVPTCLYVAHSVTEMEEHFNSFCNPTDRELLLYSCPVCYGNFLEYSDVNRHLKNVHKLSSEFLHPRINNPNPTIISFWEECLTKFKWARCLNLDCKYIESNIKTLKAHYLYCVKTQGKFLKCRECKAWLKNGISLVNHFVDVHDPSKPLPFGDQIIEKRKEITRTFNPGLGASNECLSAKSLPTANSTTGKEGNKKISCSSFPRLFVNNGSSDKREENSSGKPLRRRGFNRANLISWLINIEKTGYVLCSFKNCNFLALDVDDMSNHYSFCNSDGANISHLCEFCQRGSDSADKILRHKIFHHPDRVSYEDMNAYMRRQDDLIPCSYSHCEPSRVLKRSWAVLLELKNYIKCLVPTCFYISCTVEDMENHFNSFCTPIYRKMLLYSCPVCDGKFLEYSDVNRHCKNVHKPFNDCLQPRINSMVPAFISFWEECLIQFKWAQCLNQQCKYIESDIKTLKAHYLFCDGTKGNFLECRECKFWLKNGNSLVNHFVFIHDPNNPVTFEDQIINKRKEILAGNINLLETTSEDNTTGCQNVCSTSHHNPEFRCSNDEKMLMLSENSVESLDNASTTHEKFVKHFSKKIKFSGMSSPGISSIISDKSNKSIPAIGVNETESRLNSNENCDSRKGFISMSLQDMANKLVADPNIPLVPVKISVEDQCSWTVNVPETSSLCSYVDEYPSFSHRFWNAVKEDMLNLISKSERFNSIRNVPNVATCSVMHRNSIDKREELSRLVSCGPLQSFNNIKSQSASHFSNKNYNLEANEINVEERNGSEINNSTIFSINTLPNLGAETILNPVQNVSLSDTDSDGCLGVCLKVIKSANPAKGIALGSNDRKSLNVSLATNSNGEEKSNSTFNNSSKTSQVENDQSSQSDLAYSAQKPDGSNTSIPASSGQLRNSFNASHGSLNSLGNSNESPSMNQFIPNAYVKEEPVEDEDNLEPPESDSALEDTIVETSLPEKIEYPTSLDLSKHSYKQSDDDNRPKSCSLDNCVDLSRNCAKQSSSENFIKPADTSSGVEKSMSKDKSVANVTIRGGQSRRKSSIVRKVHQNEQNSTESTEGDLERINQLPVVRNDIEPSPNAKQRGRKRKIESSVTLKATPSKVVLESEDAFLLESQSDKQSGVSSRSRRPRQSYEEIIIPDVLLEDDAALPASVCSVNPPIQRKRKSTAGADLLSSLGPRIGPGSSLDSPDKIVKCDVCKEEMTAEVYQRDHILKHSFLCWLEEEKPLPLDDYPAMTLFLNRCKKIFPKQPLSCPKCGVVKKSAVGFLSHYQFCGKSSEEMNSLKSICQVCQRMFKPSNIDQHLVSAHRVPTDAPIDIVRPRIPRKSSSKFLEFPPVKTNQEGDEDIVPSDFVATDLISAPVEDYATLLQKWKETLSKDNIIICPIDGCEFACGTLPEMKKHYSVCEVSGPYQPFVCKLCSFRAQTRETLKNHITDAHSNQNQSSVLAPTEIVYPIPVLKEVEDQLYSSFSFLRQSSFFRPAMQWTSDLRKEIHTTESLFPDWVVSSKNWTLVDNSEPFIHTLSESVMLKFESNEWSRVNRYSSVSEPGSSSCLFTGGPVTAMAWAPTPDNILREQYLAVAGHLSPGLSYLMGQLYKEANTIQLWSYGLLINEKPREIEPFIGYCICINDGCVWDMCWCPSGCNDERRLGILAVALSCGEVHIYTVPYPYQLTHTNENVPMYQCKPEMRLRLRGKEAFQCKRVSWAKVKPHNIIVAGYTNGIVGVWNLSVSSTLLRQGNELYPFCMFQAHHSIVTSVSMCPVSNDFLLTASMDRNVRLWDLKFTSMPLQSVNKGTFTDADWLPHWVAFASAVDAGYVNATSTGMCSSVRDFSFITSQVLNSYSATSMSLSTSDWLNAAAFSFEDGNVVGMFGIRQMGSGTDSTKRRTKYIVQCKLTRLPSTETKKKLMKSNSSHDVPNNSACYEETAAMFGLHFSLSRRVEDSLKTMKSAEDCRYDVYSIQSATKVCFNPNAQSFLSLAVGYESGFVIVPSLLLPNNSSELVQSLIPKKS